MPDLLVTIITSAAVGTLVSGVITLAGQEFERRSRRRELLLAKAIELSIEKTRFVSEVAFKTGKGAVFQDQAVSAAAYFRALEHLLKHGSLPEGFEEKEKQK